MKLYGSETSPYVRKARVLTIEKGLACEFVKADAWAADSAVPAMNPLGKVPVLVRDNGDVLYDSPVIVEYLDSLKAPTLLASSGEARWIMLRWQALADGILDATVARLLESRRAEAQRSADDIRRQEGKIARALDWTESQVSGAYLMGEAFGFADLVMGVALDYVDFRYAHDWRQRCPKLAVWHEPIRHRASFAGTRAPGMK